MLFYILPTFGEKTRDLQNKFPFPFIRIFVSFYVYLIDSFWKCHPSCGKYRAGQLSCLMINITRAFLERPPSYCFYMTRSVLRSVSEHYRKSILKWFQSWRRFCLNMEKVDIANYLFFGTQFTRCLDGTKRPFCNKILEQIISWHNNNFWLIFLCTSQETGIFLVKLITVQHEKFDEGWLL